MIVKDLGMDYVLVWKQIKISCQKIVFMMKTKTGQFLMQHGKAKNVPTIVSSQTKQPEARIVTPIKKQVIHVEEQPKREIKNKQGRKQSGSREKKQTYQRAYQQQLIRLRDQNRVLCGQIDRLRKQCAQLKISMQQKQQSVKLASEKQTSYPTNSPKKGVNKENIQQLPSSSQQQRKQIQSLRQKLSTLQVQNYRLIESNYVLLIRLKKAAKFYKDSLLKIANMLENMEFAEASREIYAMLGRMKGEEGLLEGLQTQMGRKQEARIDNIQKKESPIIKQRKKLSLVSGVCQQSHFIPFQSLNEFENSIQVNLRHLESPRYQHPYNSFHLLSQHQPPKSVSEFPSKKLFNSEIREPNLLDQSPSAKEFTEWENGNGSVKRVVHKCHGNSVELYKMLLVQASVIQSLF